MQSSQPSNIHYVRKSLPGSEIEDSEEECRHDRVDTPMPMNSLRGSSSFQEMADQMWEKHQTCCTESRVTNPLKALVSKSKKRFSWDGYDLDLAYITENIIAMGFPSQKLESIYRNSMEQVRRFLRQRHAGHYRVYNLCSQKKYDKENFQGNVMEFPFDDHMAPPFELIFSFCEDMDDWLKRDKRNIAAVHCKAGKGRTGLMICCYLIWSGVVAAANDALDYYALMRTFNEKGVTIPSQIRYVRYFQLGLKTSLTAVKYLNNIPEIKLKRIKVSAAPNISVFGGCMPWVLLTCRQGDYKSKYTHDLTAYPTGTAFQLPLQHMFRIRGDFKLTFLNKGLLNKSERFMHVWLNTYFLSEMSLVLTGRQIDGVKADDTRFSERMQVTLEYIRC